MFPFKNKEVGTRGSTCLACMAAYGREHYARHRAKYLEKAHRSRRRVRAKNDQRILSYLLAHPCVDCGETDPLVLDFDHRDPATKSNEVSRIVYYRPWRVVLEEIEIGGLSRSRAVLTANADEGAGKVRQGGRSRFIGFYAGVENLRQLCPRCSR